MPDPIHPSRFAFVGPFPPTACGIATFTESLRTAFLDLNCGGRHVEVDVIRLLDEPEASRPNGVAANWVRGNDHSLRAVTALANGYDMVVMQHEFGIFGGIDGDETLSFIGGCSVPVAVVLHTVVPDPSPHQRQIIESLVSRAAVTIVQSQAAMERLRQAYRVGRSRIIVIPHGAVANFEGSRVDLSVNGQPVLLTWGLLGPGKGIEHTIRAIAALPPGFALPTYVVAGRTHPNVVARDGEQYRESLNQLAQDLGVAQHIVFDDSYKSWDELRTMVRSCDVVVLPYDNRDQVTSGVLVEALASGRPVIATAFPHALEALASGAGIVVPHEDPLALANAIEHLLANPARHRFMVNAARAEASSLLWPTVARSYLDQLTRPLAALEVA